MSKVRRAIIFSSVTRYTAKLLGLLSTMIIARMLTPEEIGTFAIASAIVMVMSEFRLLGAGAYLIREKELSEDKIRSAIGLTIIISWSFGLAIWVAAPVVANWYELGAISTIFRILSVSFFFAPFISIPISIMNRNFDFKSLFYIKSIASISQIVMVVVLITQGFSYFSLAWGQVAAVVVQLLLLFYFRPGGITWIPSFSNLSVVARVGLYTSIANFFRRAVVTAPDMVIGKMGTTTQVGMFSRGLGFVEFLSQSLMMGINPVALPYLSDTKRTGGNMSAAYIRASVLLGGLIWPVLAVCSQASLPAIRLFFGDQWDMAAPLASWLAIWAMFRTVHWLSNSLLTASGKERVMVIKESALFAVFFAAIIVAYPYGLEFVAIAFVLVSVLDISVTSLVLQSVVNIRLVAFIKAWVPNLLVTFVCWSVTFLISMGVEFSDANYWLPILIIAIILPPVWLLSLKVFVHPLYDELFKMLRSAFPRFSKFS